MPFGITFLIDMTSLLHIIPQECLMDCIQNPLFISTTQGRQ